MILEDGANRLIYNDLSISSNVIRIEKDSLSVPELQLTTDDGTAIRYLVEIYQPDLYDVVNFGLAFLDYSNSWSLYYVFIKPEVVFPGVEPPAVTGTTPDGHTVSSKITGDFIAKEECIVLDSHLINTTTINDYLYDFNNKSRTATWDPYRPTSNPTNQGYGNASITISAASFTVDIPYREMNPQHIYSNIERIYTDFR